MSSTLRSSHGESPATGDSGVSASHPLLGLFLRFLRFGLLAWGGPTAQIAMIRDSLVERERWITPERFNRVLAVYQALPGPEAHELCCYFGMLARGRAGSIIAGLGFMLPGLVFMLACSWLYVKFGFTNPWVLAAFAGCQPAVVALLARGAIRIGRHALAGVDSPIRCAIALGAAAAHLIGAHFAVSLVAGAVVLGGARKRWWAAAMAGAALWLGLVLAWMLYFSPISATSRAQRAETTMGSSVSHPPGPGALLTTGLGAGMLSFGGAYTAIPILHRDAVGDAAGEDPGWMTSSQFLDGLAISGVLPAPMVIFGTFVGWLGGGWVGALLVTFGIFLPAFGFTFIGHEFLERIVDNERLHALLDGVTSAVVGIMAATAVQIAIAAVHTPVQLTIAAATFTLLSTWKSRWATPVGVLGAAGVGMLLRL